MDYNRLFNTFTSPDIWHFILVVPKISLPWLVLRSLMPTMQPMYLTANLNLTMCYYSIMVQLRHKMMSKLWGSDGVSHLGVPHLPTWSVRLLQGRFFLLTLPCCAAHFLPELNISSSIPRIIPQQPIGDCGRRLVFDGIFFVVSSKRVKNVLSLLCGLVPQRAAIDYVKPYFRQRNRRPKSTYVVNKIKYGELEENVEQFIELSGLCSWSQVGGLVSTRKSNASTLETSLFLH